MENSYKYLFGPVPSRRMGVSLGISPIPERTCSYSCVYCQLGRTKHMQSERKLFFPVRDIVDEFIHYQKSLQKLDVISIVGEGEPTLYSGLGELIDKIKEISDVPVAVITNSSLLADSAVQNALLNADIVLPSMDAYDEKTFRKIKYDRVYINTPVRPPAESFAEPPSKEQIQKAVEKLSAISIDMLSTGNFFSDVSDHYEAIKNICQRHPMNSFELETFLSSRDVADIETYKKRLEEDPEINCIKYKGITSYRLK